MRTTSLSMIRRKASVGFEAQNVNYLKSTVSLRGNGGASRRKIGLSVFLLWDIKNAFNPPNHRSIFIVLEAKDLPAADIDLIRRLYNGSFLSIGNLFGEAAASFIARGCAQGAPPSPIVFEMTYGPFPTLIRALQRGCTVEALEDPSGSSPFAVT